MANAEMTVGQVRLDDDGTKLNLSVQMNNPTSRTLHAYGTVRQVEYDPATRTLDIWLTDRNVPTLPFQGMQILPQIVPVPANGEATIEVTLPRVLKRMRSGENLVSPEIETLPIFEATTVHIHVAWGDTPFYPSSGPDQAGIRPQL